METTQNVIIFLATDRHAKRRTSNEHFRLHTTPGLIPELAGRCSSKPRKTKRIACYRDCE